MSDPRLQEIAERAKAAARPTDFADVARRGRRRRTSGVFGAAAATALVLAGTALGVRGAYDDSTAPAHPVSPAPTTSTTASTTAHTTPGTPRQSITAEQIVDDPKATVTGIAIAADDSDVRASMWYLCSDPVCSRGKSAVAITADAFRHVRYVRADMSPLTWVVGDTFVIRRVGSGLWTVDATGAVRPLRIMGDATPLSTGETLLSEPGSNTAYGIDGATLVAHPIHLPPQSSETYASLTQQGQNLWGLGADTETVFSSSDGGATWRAPYLLKSGPWGSLHGTVDSGDPSTLVVNDRADDEGYFPRFHRSRDGGGSWELVDPPQFQLNSAAWAVIAPSGYLLVYIRSNPRLADSSATGLYESDNISWSHFHAVKSSPSLHSATHSQNDGGRLLASIVDGQGRQSLFLAAGRYADSQAVGDVMSSDGGRTWTATRYR